MGWMKIAGFVFVLGLVAACNIDAKTPNKCQANEQCPEGAYCDVGHALCVLACEKAGCLEGHFCDPDSHYCKDYCPHACPDRPANATLICGDVCVYACIDGFRECAEHAGACLSDSSDPTACGASCEESKVCAVPQNGTAVCNNGACGSTCNAEFYDNTGSCEICDQPQHCGASCMACTPPAHSTAECTNGACGVNCDTGFHFCDNRCVSDTDATACGPSCKACPAETGTATCNGGACGVACSTGFHLVGTICAPNNEETHCGAGNADCTANGTLTGMICNGGVVCVQNARFSRNTSVPSQPTVKDKDTGLIWQGCAAGLSGNDCSGGTVEAKKWQQATDYCAALNGLNWGGYNTDWRLPTQPSKTDGELSSILLAPYNKCSTSPCIDTTAFPNTPALCFWSSSPYAYDRGSAWIVDFDNGYVSAYGKSSTRYVRCVRSGP